MVYQKYFTEEERKAAGKISKHNWYIKNKEVLPRTKHWGLTERTHAIIAKWRDDNNLQGLNQDQVMQRILRMAKIIELRAVDYAPQLKGR